MFGFISKLIGFGASTSTIAPAPAADAPAKVQNSGPRAFAVTTAQSKEFAVVVDSYGMLGPSTTFGWTKDKARASCLTQEGAEVLKQAAEAEHRVFQNLLGAAPAVFKIVDLRAAQGKSSSRPE